MAIQLVSVQCPHCGANLEIENDREFAFCSYCGTKVMLSNDNEHIYRHIDEARIKENETERMIRLKEMEFEEREAARERKTTLVAYGIALGFVLIGALVCIWEPIGGMWGFIIGAYIALFTYIKGDQKKKKRKYVGPYSVQINSAMTDCVDKHYNSALMKFRSAGFTNVSAVPLCDLNIFTMRKNGLVESITINGDDGFEKDDVFPKDANVLIHYHSK